MPRPRREDELMRRKREIRLRIGRSRRHIDLQLRAAQDGAARLLWWRSYVTRYPGWASVAAFGAGLAASGGLRPRRLSRRLRRLLMHTTDRLRQQLRSELRRLWPASRSQQPGQASPPSNSAPANPSDP